MRQRTEGTYYRRHQDCARGRTGFTYEQDERRAWKACMCSIYFYGRLRPEDPKAIRKRTGAIDWRDAEAAVEAWRSGLPDPPPPPAPEPTPGRIAVEEAGKLFVAKSRDEDQMAKSTLKKYRVLVRKMVVFSVEQRHYHCIDQWVKADVRAFLAWWPGSARTSQKRLSSLRCLFAFAEEEKWITENPAVFPRRKNKTRAQRLIAKKGDDVAYPYTDKEIAQMVWCCDHEYGSKPIPSPRKRSDRVNQITNCSVRDWTGADVRDFILLSVYLGLRIGQVATFHTSMMNEHGDVHFRAIKNGEHVDTWAPDWLQAIIKDRAKRFGPFIFGARETDDADHIADSWRERLEIIWALCEYHIGPWSPKAVHHRFRHTFVRILLVNGTPVPKVAELIGDTEDMVRKTYSAWVPERQEQIRATLRGAFATVLFAPAVGEGKVIPFRK